MKRQLLISFILLMSGFWPFAYAQPVSTTKAVNTSPTSCSLGNLGVVNMDYDTVNAIQGMVTQDILTSAENYKTMKALQAVGINQTTGPAKVVKKYRLYFVGPDGEVKYADIIENKFTPAQDWLLNTTIFGRVEYGGLMGEDLLVCPDLPTNEKGMCNYKAGSKIEDVYSKDWTVGVEVNVSNPKKALQSAEEEYGHAYFDTVSNFVQMATNSQNPFGKVDIGMSRFRAHRYVVSIAAPAGSQLFVIPKTYMYFMARLKNLALFEGVAQAAFMIGGVVNIFKGLRSGEGFARNRLSFLEGTKKDLKAKRLGLLKFMKGSSNDINSVDKSITDISGIVSEERKGLIPSLESTLSDLSIKSDLPSDLTGYLEKLPSSEKNKFLAALVAGDEKTALKLFPTLPGKDMEYREKIVNALIAKYKNNPTALFDVSSDAGLNARELAAKLEVLDGVEDNLSPMEKEIAEISKIKDPKEKAQAIASFRKKYSSNLEDLLHYIDAKSVAIDKFASTGEASLWTKLGLYGTPTDKQISNQFLDVLTSAEPKSPFHGFFGLSNVVPSADIPVVLKARSIGAAGAFLRAYLKGLYYVGRPITALAWGSQVFSELFAMNGYLQLSPPGLTLAWDPTTTGKLFTKDSYILIKGTPSSIPGMYSAGALGSLGAQQIAEFLLGAGVDPLFAGKYSNFGQYFIFGYDFNPNAYNAIIKVEKEGQPTGITRLVKTNNGYLLKIANWKQEGFSVVEDPTTMEKVGNGTLLTSVGMFTDGADMYGYIYSNPQQVKTQFPVTWTFAEKIGNFGFLSEAVTAASIMYLWPTIPRLAPAIGAPLITGLSKSLSAGGKDLFMAKTTDMRQLENCVTSGNCTRRPCEQVCAQCEGELSVMSTWLVASGIAQTAMSYSVALDPVSFALGAVDMVVLEGGIPLPGGGIKLFEGKMEKTRRCLNELLTCNERDFIIIAGQKIQNPDVLLQQQQQASKLKSLPGLSQLPVQDLLKPLKNITSPINLDQEQLNIHGEVYNVTGRVAMRDIYYMHIMDATIDFLANKFPLHMCGLTANKSISQCVDIDGNTIKYGNRTITSPLVPFKWMDTKMPAVVIPNTAVYLNISDSECPVFTVSPHELEPVFNSNIGAKFNTLNFTDLERTFGDLRVINLDEGSIYPVTNVDGKLRLELDRNDGGYEETDGPVVLHRNGKVTFVNLENKTEELTFRSAVFSGGTVVKKGNAIYILPRYFRPSMSGIQWRQLVGTKLFQSTNGQSPVALDKNGNLIGINAMNTKIPGASKLGVITAVSAYKDLNGDGKIEDNEKAGWRFYKQGNHTYFELYYKGHKELYNASQVSVGPDGTIRIYQNGKPHTDAYLLRQISTRVDNLGRTLMTIKDGQGNTLLKDALVSWIKGTGGSIQYNPDTNNYVFVNGQPIELNNEFKTNGFNAVTGLPNPPLLQPSAVHGQKPWEGETNKQALPPVVPTVPSSQIGQYVISILAGLVAVYMIGRKKKGSKQSS